MRPEPAGANEVQMSDSPADEALDASFPASDPVSIVTSHAEEDWGTEPAVPDPPAAKPSRNP